MTTTRSKQEMDHPPEAFPPAAGDNGVRIGGPVQVGANQVLGREQLQLMQKHTRTRSKTDERTCSLPWCDKSLP